MGGQQLKIQAIGAAREAFCQAMMGTFAAMIPVDRPHDFGIDLYCQPRIPVGDQTETATELCGVQVKSSSAGGLSFGGLEKGVWKRQELECLRCLAVPLFLAVVDDNYERIDVYSVTRSVQVFWKTDYPFRIDCKLSAPEYSTPVETPEPQSEVFSEYSGHGDGRVWTVQLGAPLLSLLFQDLSDEATRADRCRVLRRWIGADRWSLYNLSAGIPRVKLVHRYRTNEIPDIDFHIMFWNPSQDSQAVRIGEAIAPAVTALGRHLKAQGKLEEAHKWLGALEWCSQRGILDSLGVELLTELKSAP